MRNYEIRLYLENSLGAVKNLMSATIAGLKFGCAFLACTEIKVECLHKQVEQFTKCSSESVVESHLLKWRFLNFACFEIMTTQL